MNGKALISPVTFDAASRWLKGRVNVLTEMGAKEIAESKNFRPKVRASAFFSARVAEARVLDQLREISDEYSSGKLDLATARKELKNFLYGEGYRPDDVSEGGKAGKSIKNLASTARLDLILTQNARMAAAVGQREVSFDPDILERFPYFRYLPSTAVNKRDDHKQFYNLVLPKTHPFWDTHTPPLEFNCKCGIEDATKEEAENIGISSASAGETEEGPWKITTPSGRTLTAGPSGSGYEFNVRQAFEICDMSRIKNIPMRKAVFVALRSFHHENPDTRFKCVPETMPSDVPVLENADSVQGLGNFLAEQMRQYGKDASFNENEIFLGELSAQMRDALGFGINARFSLSSGSSSYGLRHAIKNHAAELKDGRFLKALKDTLYAKERHSVSVEFTGKKVYIGVDNRKTGAFASFYKLGDEWDNWQLVSAHYPGEKYGEQRREVNR
jgi:hypothetical protein